MTDTCECTRRPGCGCSRCWAPDVVTELIEGDPWEIGFSDLGMLSGSGYIGGAPISHVFTVYPSTELPWSTVYFEPDQDWPEGSYQIYDQDGNPVYPDIPFELDGAEDFTLVIDPTNFETPGTYTGRLHHDRNENEDGSGDSDEHEKAVEEDIQNQTDEQIGFTSYATISIPVSAGGSTKNYSVGFKRTTGDEDMKWKLAFIPDDAILSGTVSISNNGATVDPDTIYGPISGSSIETVALIVNPTTYVNDNTYTGKLRLSGYVEGIGGPGDNILMNTVERNVQIVVSAAETPVTKYFELSVVSPWLRGVAEDIVVTAKNPDGTTDLDYGLSDDFSRTLNINITSIYSPADSAFPDYYQLDPEDWLDGVATIPDIILAGGTGAKTPTLQVYDVSNGVYGVLVLNVQDGAAGTNYPITISTHYLKNGISIDNDPVSYPPLGPVWDLAYSDFLSDAFDSTGATDLEAENETDQSIVYGLYTSAAALRVRIGRYNTSAKNGDYYTNVDITVDNLDNVLAANIYFIPSASATPPTSKTGHPFITITGTGAQNKTFNTVLIMDDYLYVWVEFQAWSMPVDIASDWLAKISNSMTFKSS